jgi:trans-L-3-hydroxyproline dehydratase
MLEKRRYAKQNLDHLRKALMFEPRGHADMYGAILTDSVTEDGDIGVLFTHNEGFSTMCGHGVIALATMAFEIGAMEVSEADGPRPTMNLDTPAGRVTAYADWDAAAKRVRRVSFENVPSYAYALGQTINVPGLGAIQFDIGFGGAFYAYVDVAANGLDVQLNSEDYRAIIDIGMRIKRAVMTSHVLRHPFEEDMGFLYGTILYDHAHDKINHSRNVCVFAEGEVDRSPTGTGMSGRLALEWAKGRLGLGQPFTIESLIGTTFTGKVVRETTFGPHAAIVPEVSGRAWITGRHEFLMAPDDPLREGFVLR